MCFTLICTTPFILIFENLFSLYLRNHKVVVLVVEIEQVGKKLWHFLSQNSLYPLLSLPFSPKILK